MLLLESQELLLYQFLITELAPGKVSLRYRLDLCKTCQTMQMLSWQL